MFQRLTGRHRWLIIILITVLGVGCALLGKWGRLLSVVMISFSLMIVTSGCLAFCRRHGFNPGSEMLLALGTAAGYVLLILGSYGYLLHG